MHVTVGLRVAVSGFGLRPILVASSILGKTGNGSDPMRKHLIVVAS